MDGYGDMEQKHSAEWKREKTYTTLHTHHLTNGEIEEGKIYENQTKNKQNGQANTNYFSEPMFIAFIRTSVIYKRMRR